MSDDLIRNFATKPGSDETETLDTTESEVAADGADLRQGSVGVSVFQPGAGESITISAQPGALYILEFDPGLAETAVEDGAVVFRFPDGGEIIIRDLDELISRGLPPKLLVGETDVLTLLPELGQTADVVLARPAAGEILIIESWPGQRIELGFEASEGRAVIEDDLFAIRFSDGGELQFPGFGAFLSDPDALGASYAGNPPVFVTDGTAIDAAAMVILAADWSGSDFAGLIETAAGDRASGSGGLSVEDQPIELVTGLRALDPIPGVEATFTVPEVEDPHPFISEEASSVVAPTPVDPPAPTPTPIPEGQPEAQSDLPDPESDRNILYDNLVPDEAIAFVTGNLFGNDSFGPDGPGSPKIPEITYLGGLGAAGDSPSEILAADLSMPGAGVLFLAGTSVSQFTGPGWTLIVATEGPSAGQYLFNQTTAFAHDLGSEAEFQDGLWRYAIQDGDGDISAAQFGIRAGSRR